MAGRKLGEREPTDPFAPSSRRMRESDSEAGLWRGRNSWCGREEDDEVAGEEKVQWRSLMIPII